MGQLLPREIMDDAWPQSQRDNNPEPPGISQTYTDGKNHPVICKALCMQGSLYARLYSYTTMVILTVRIL